ncbi:MAG TPA: hypothetical protein VM118_02265, partial [Acidobacteriota bacterium]|nr:hypothetical protein [Acidobacteriota bacterium]
FACHMWDYASRNDVGVNNVDDIAAGAIFVHGQNKVWIYSDRVGAGSGQSSKAFLNGYAANVDHVTRTCSSETCHVHTKTWNTRP